MARLTGKIALVTGGARGLGAAIVRRFAEEGAQVVLTDVLEVAGEELAASLEQCAFLRHDVRDEDSWRMVIDEIARRHGRLDILVNNAGVVHLGGIEACTLEDWRAQQSVILEGAFLGCKYALPLLPRTGGGAIVNVTALAAERGVGSLPAYCAAKAGVHGLSRSLAIGFRERGERIRVNCVAPGAHDTPMTRALSGAAPPAMAAPVEVANTVLFLASDEARHINGQIIFVDNGQSAGSGSIPFLVGAKSTHGTNLETMAVQ